MISVATTIKNIEQAERLLAEMKHNLLEIEKADTYSLSIFQEMAKDRYGFPKHPLNVRKSALIYIVNLYSDLIYKVLTNTNTGIPLKTILEIMNKDKNEVESCS